MTFDDIRKLAAGFQPAKLFLTALDLGVFDQLADGELGAEVLADALGVEPRATAIALDALTALGFLEKGAGGYRNAEAAAKFLTRRSPEYRGEILSHLHATWEDWTELEGAWRTGEPALRRQTQQLPSSEEGMRHFVLGMENVTRELAPKIAALLPLDGCRKVLDLGGGPGNYALAFARQIPGLEVVHFDLPPTSKIAREFVDEKAGSERVDFLAGDFLRDDMGGGYDFVWASQIIHMLGEEDLRELLRRIGSVLVSGGRVAIHDQFLDPGKTSPRSASLFGVHMLVVTGRGRTYSFEEVEGWLGEAGVWPERRVEYGGPSRILVARRGES